MTTCLPPKPNYGACLCEILDQFSKSDGRIKIAVGWSARVRHVRVCYYVGT